MNLLRLAVRLALLCVAGALASCAGPSADFVASGGASGQAFPASPSVSVSEQSRGDYRVRQDDIVEVFVYQVNDFNRSAQVDAAGNIGLPLLGAVKAAGRTTREIEADITAKLKVKYLQNPQVSVMIKDAVGMRVTVEGAVKKPGMVAIRGDMTLLRVLAEAQGFTDTADQGGVLVFRQTAQGKAVARFDANAIRAGSAADPVIFGGDTVVVDESTGKIAWKQFREAVPALGLFKLLI